MIVIRRRDPMDKSVDPMDELKHLAKRRWGPGLSPGTVALLATILTGAVVLLTVYEFKGATPDCVFFMTQEKGIVLLPLTASWSPLVVARCRAFCLKEYPQVMNDDGLCKKDFECNACWDDCDQIRFKKWAGKIQCAWRLSQNTWSFPACQFLKELTAEAPPAQPVLETKAEALLEMEGLQLNWPCHGGTIHLVLWKVHPWDNWTQLTQTTDCSATLPQAGSARILSVNTSGLTAIYTPADPSSNVISERLPEVPGTVEPANGSEWSLRLASVIHQGAVVIAELSWRSPDTDLELARKKGTLLYLVTWEVDGGGITGNLYTDSSCVTLSLSADTVFHIQVELVLKPPSGPSRSPQLVVDTGGDFAVGSFVLVPRVQTTNVDSVTGGYTMLAFIILGVFFGMAILTIRTGCCCCWCCCGIDILKNKSKAVCHNLHLGAVPVPVNKEVNVEGGNEVRISVSE